MIRGKKSHFFWLRRLLQQQELPKFSGLVYRQAELPCNFIGMDSSVFKAKQLATCKDKVIELSLDLLF